MTPTSISPRTSARTTPPHHSAGAAAVDHYLAAVPEPSRTTLNQVRATIRTTVPPGTTELISYGIPAFHYKGNLIGYAAFKNHCSLFPMSGRVIDAFKSELSPFHTSKGTLRFSSDRPLPSSLLKRLVKARIAENENKKQR
jgi:uncharacterized protein YdhG (YjbR/CyaY superfamily)